MCKLSYYTNSINCTIREFEEGYYDIFKVEGEIEYLLRLAKDDDDITQGELTMLNCFRRVVTAMSNKCEKHQDILIKKGMN